MERCFSFFFKIRGFNCEIGKNWIHQLYFLWHNLWEGWNNYICLEIMLCLSSIQKYYQHIIIIISANFQFQFRLHKWNDVFFFQMLEIWLTQSLYNYLCSFILFCTFPKNLIKSTRIIEELTDKNIKGKICNFWFFKLIPSKGNCHFKFHEGEGGEGGRGVIENFDLTLSSALFASKQPFLSISSLPFFKSSFSCCRREGQIGQRANMWNFKLISQQRYIHENLQNLIGLYRTSLRIVYLHQLKWYPILGRASL